MNPTTSLKHCSKRHGDAEADDLRGKHPQLVEEETRDACTMNSLAHEILYEIFIRLSRLHSPCASLDFLPLLLIRWLWKGIAIACPQLWADIPIFNMVPTEEMLEQSKDAPLIITEDSEATIGTELHAAFQLFHRVEELESDEKCELQIRPGISANRSPPADFAPYLSQSKHVDQQAHWTRRPYSTERPSRLLSSGLPIPRNLVKLDPPSMWHIPRHALIDTAREAFKPTVPYPRGRVHSRTASGSRGTPRSDSISNRTKSTAPTWGFEGWRGK